MITQPSSTAHPEADIDDLDDTFLRRNYDAGSLRRGIAYFREERVRLMHAGAGSIDAVCRGSGSSTYVVRVRWNGSAGLVSFDDECSCPLGGRCKHAVATILTARSEGTAAVGRGNPAWRQSLSGLDLDDDAEPTPIALQFSFRRPTRYSSGTGSQLAVRPMLFGRSGKWIKTGASWSEIASPYNRRTAGCDPHQLDVMRSLMASSNTPAYSSSTASLLLGLFSSDVWHHLDRAVESGIDLIAERPYDRVVLEPAAVRVGIDLSADAEGTVELSVTFGIDGGEIDIHSEHVGMVGSPPHGVWVAEGGVLRLFRLATSMHPTVGRLAHGVPLSVPATDVDELLDVYLPELSRHATIGSSDGSVTIATSELEGLVLAIDRVAIDQVDLLWSVRYRRGRRVVDHLLRRATRHGRDLAAEAAALEDLELPTHLVADLADADGRPQDVHLSGTDAVTLLTEVVPWLEAKSDVRVVVSGDQPALVEATGGATIALRVEDADDDRAGHDWFDLDVRVEVDGQVVDFVPLFTALDRGDELLVLPSGTWLRLDHPQLRRLRELIEEARGLVEPGRSGIARVNRFQTSWWEDLVELGVVAHQSDRWARNIEEMGELSAPTPVARPSGLEAELRPYQQSGLDWLAFLHRHRLGGVLADDMGLGKTVQAIALCLHVLEEDPDARFLVVAPTSVVENWAHEAERFAPGVGVRTIRETTAKRGSSLVDAIGDARMVVTSYAIFRIDVDDMAGLDWELLLLDEAQFVKNHRSKTYRCVRQLDVDTKIAMTGTPMENSLMDLWSLLSIAAPGLYPDPKRFDRTYRKPIEKGAAPELLATLRRRIAPLMRRRTKDEVLTELPPKTEQTVEVELGTRHARIYETELQRHRREVLGLVGDVQKHRFTILRSLTVLRQLALDPGLVDDAHGDVGSAKLDRLLDDLGQVVAEGHRALVFSQFTRFLGRVRGRLDDAGIAHSYLDGRTRKRDEAISSFKQGDVPVFVISLKAGGFGLNLAEADYCFVLDPWWNPATETQAVDRAHRIGQQNPVMVYRYVSVGTIEEKVMELKARKADLFADVIDADGALGAGLTDDDIRGLFDLE